MRIFVHQNTWGTLMKFEKKKNFRLPATLATPLYHVISLPKITEAPALALHRKQWPPSCSAKPVNTRL